MFGLFAKKEKAAGARVRTAEDAVYLDDRLRLDAVAKEIRDNVRKERVTTIVTPFSGHVARIRAGLDARGIVTSTLDLDYRTPTLAPDEVYVIGFDALPTLLRDTRSPRVFLQVERHPLRAHDDEAARRIEANSPEHRLLVRLALDDGLLTFFDAGGSLAGLMKRLDVPAEEPVEHGLVTRSLENAQAKVAKKVRSEVRAATFAEWRAVNVPPGSEK